VLRYNKLLVKYQEDEQNIYNKIISKAAKDILIYEL